MEDLNNLQLKFDTSHSIRPPKQEEYVIVHTSDLKRLRWHMDRIEIHSPEYDWPSAIIGAAASLIIPFIIDFTHNDKAYLVHYLIAFTALSILFAVSLLYRNRKQQQLNPQQSLDEVIQDLKTIYEKANLPYSTQYAGATVSGLGDHRDK